MRITNETIKSILALRFRQSELSQFNSNFRHDGAFKCLEYLYPLSSTRRKTKLRRQSTWGSRHIIIHKELREVGSGNIQSDPVASGTWLEYYCNPDNFELIEDLSKFIPDMRKRREFLKIHEILGELKFRLSPGQHIIINRVLDEPIDFYTFHNTHRYGHKEYDGEGDHTGQITEITFNGSSVELIVKDQEKFKLEISTNDILMLNIVDKIKDILMEIFDEWKQKVDEAVKGDEETIFKARQVVAKYEIVDKL